MAGRPGSSAAYDAIADWYAGWVIGSGADYMARAYAALQRSLGRGTGVCWDLACGTGESASVLNELGWTVVGSDISRGQLRHASKRIPVVLADATRPPVRPGTIAAVASVLCHTDIDDYAAVCRSAAMALRPGGRFAHVGIHPCFVGPFVDGSDRSRLITTSGYWTRERATAGWTSSGIRSRVGAVHRPLSDIVNAITSAGLTIDRVEEAGDPTPDVLAIGAYRPREQTGSADELA
jgi:SAM-dependent methyltransferase